MSSNDHDVQGNYAQQRFHDSEKESESDNFYNRHGQGDVSDCEIKERLKVAEKMLTLREQQVLAREDGLDTVEEGLKLRKDDLRFREEDLNIRQEELDVREQRLLAREQELENQIRDI